MIGLRIGEEMARTHLTTIVTVIFASFDKVHMVGTPEVEMEVVERDRECDGEDGALNELREVLTPEVAYSSYVAFYHLLGGGHLDASLSNLELIKRLCCRHQASLNAPPHRPIAFSELQAVTVVNAGSSSFGTSGTGNKIENPRIKYLIRFKQIFILR